MDASAHAVTATYLVCLARSSMTHSADHMRTTGGGDAYLAMTELGIPDVDITLVIDVGEHLVTRWAAIRPTAAEPAHTTTCPRSSSMTPSPRTASASSGASRTYWHTVPA